MTDKNNKVSKLTLKKQSITKPYPWLRILIGFGIFGGWVGATMAILIIVLAGDIGTESWQGFDFKYFFKSMFEGLVFKMIVGLLPALITAGFVIYQKLHLRTFRDWFQLGLVGFIATIPFSLIAMTMAESIDYDIFFLAIIVGLSGLFSALIIGSLTIPKS